VFQVPTLIIRATDIDASKESAATQHSETSAVRLLKPQTSHHISFPLSNRTLNRSNERLARSNCETRREITWHSGVQLRIPPCYNSIGKFRKWR